MFYHIDWISNILSPPSSISLIRAARLILSLPFQIKLYIRLLTSLMKSSVTVINDALLKTLGKIKRFNKLYPSQKRKPSPFPHIYCISDRLYNCFKVRFHRRWDVIVKNDSLNFNWRFVLYEHNYFDQDDCYQLQKFQSYLYWLGGWRILKTTSESPLNGDKT